MTESRLNEHPNWRYLAREFYEMYRRSSAGGSAKIRSHQRFVVWAGKSADEAVEASLFDTAGEA